MKGEDSMNEIVFWRLDKVLAETGLKRTHLYQMVNQGYFPKQIKLGKRACAWLASEVKDWKESKLYQHKNWLNTIAR
jgi:prophage regulatory protein